MKTSDKLLFILDGQADVGICKEQGHVLFCSHFEMSTTLWDETSKTLKKPYCSEHSIAQSVRSGCIKLRNFIQTLHFMRTLQTLENLQKLMKIINKWGVT
jgi:hypothetical protein